MLYKYLSIKFSQNRPNLSSENSILDILSAHSRGSRNT